MWCRLRGGGQVSIPSLKKRLSARTSIKRYVRNSFCLKAPRGWGWITNPKRAAHNRVYSKTTGGCLVLIVAMVGGLAGLGVLMAVVTLFSTICIQVLIRVG